MRRLRAEALWLLGMIACSPPAGPPPEASTSSPGSVRPPVPASASPSPSGRAPASTPAQVSLQLKGGKGSVSSRKGLVTSVEAHATRAGVKMLEQGGNAIDAAVAVGYALAVTHPSAGNLGGGGFMLARPAGGKTVALDFRERAPAALTQARFDAMIKLDKGRGPAASGVPGTVAGLNEAHQRWGKLPLATVIGPAIELCERGHAISHREALTLIWAWRHLRKDPEARRIFRGKKKNKPKKVGQRLKRPGLARTLKLIAEHGNAGFYEGKTARKIARRSAKRGLITEADLSDYRAVEREVLEVPYRGLTVQIMPPPSAGGVAVAAMLSMLEQLQAHKHPVDSVRAYHVLTEVMKRAHTERRFGVVDPDSVDETEEAKKARLARWSQGNTWLKPHPIDLEHPTPAKSLHPLHDAAMRELEHTTHFSVVDKTGFVVSVTYTLSAGFGAGFVVPGTGIVMNNSLGAFGTVGDDVPKPGRRMTSSMSPTLVLQGERPVLVLGSPGGDTIPNTVVQVLRNIVDYQLPLADAVLRGRIHHGFVPDELRFERRRPPPSGVIGALRGMGHQISKKRIPIGDANNLMLAPDGRFYGVADPRSGGLALGPTL